MNAPARLLVWGIAGAAAIQALLWRWSGQELFSPSFRVLLALYDAHGNLLTLILLAVAWALRGHPGVLAAVRFSGERPGAVAAVAFPLLCLGALRVYHDTPVAMDEYASVFQAKAFAMGRLAGALPPDLLDFLIPSFFQNRFLSVSSASGAVSTTYWPGFALVLAPFAWLGLPWAANPAIGALALPAIHRLALRLGGTVESAGWAVLLTVASPVFVVTSISYYSMQAHLLCNVLFALLLLQPGAGRAFAAGIVGSVALTLHQPVPHLLFALPFGAWLLWRKEWGTLAALAAGYAPVVLLVGLGWHLHLVELARSSAAASAPAAAAAGPSLVESVSDRLAHVVRLPGLLTVEARIAGLSKTWTWGAPGLLVLAAWGYWGARTASTVRLLGAALAVTFLGYFLFPLDQGHGWGNRYLHSAWFVLPVLAALALARMPEGGELRAMAAWAAVGALLLDNGLRLAQVDAYVTRHLAQVPPLATAPAPGAREVVFVNLSAGFYTQDMVQNDPFLRGPRMVMVYAGPERTQALMRARFPRYARSAQGNWGELWTAR